MARKAKEMAMAPEMDSEEMDQEEMDRQAECDMRTMMDAEEIKMDPKRMKACMDKMQQKKKVITSIEQLRKIAKDKAGE